MKILWTTILLLHCVGAGAWWWAMPGGFPWDHPRFWANEVLPILAIAISAAGLYGIWANRTHLAQTVILAVPAFWTAALTATTVVYPISRVRASVPLGAIAIALWLAYFFSPTPRRPLNNAVWLGLLAAIMVGGAAPLSQRAPGASTKPLDWPLLEYTSTHVSSPDVLLPLSKDLYVESETGTTLWRVGPLSIEVGPLLTFISCSRDRCWTVLTPGSTRTMPVRRVVGRELKDKQVTLHFDGGIHQLLCVHPTLSASSWMIEAHTKLDEPVYSHLNSFCEVLIGGHQDLELSFSPCPDLRLSVEPSDYPVGRPTRFAYVDRQKQFYIVEATSGEKGPFRVLGSGPLASSGEVRMTIYDNSKLMATISFFDWAPQSSKQLSPTAGWGVPMNAIEFRRLGEGKQSRVAIWLTLAGTSVGRGWDSVGYRAGTYRNRIQLDQAP